MEIYTRIVNNNLCIAHFSFTYQEAMHIYKFVEENCDEEDIEENFIRVIETEYLNNALDERDIICVGEKAIHFLSELKENRPFVGIARFLVLPEVLHLSLPMEIPLSIINEINLKNKKVNEYLKLKLLENNYADLQDVDVIDMDCIVNYELRFIIEGDIISTYDNQILEMYKDDALQPERFVGAKVGDAVAISDVEGVVTDFLIKKIQKKMPYTQSTAKEVYYEIGYNDYDDLCDRFNVAFKKINKVNMYVDYVVDFIYENTQITYADQIYDFYKELDYFVYDKDYEFVDDESEQKKIIRKSYIFDLLAKMVELKEPEMLISDEGDIVDEYKDYHLNGIYDEYDLIIYSVKERIYRYLKKLSIIK